MNILITSKYGKVSGATYSIYWLALGLQRRGHQVWIAAPEGSFISYLCHRSSVGFVPLVFNYIVDIYALRELHRQVKVHQIDIIYAQESKDRYAAIWAKYIYRINVRLIIARRQRVADNNPWKRWLHTHGTDGIVVVSEGLRQKMIKKGFAPDSMTVIYNGMPLDDFTFSLPDVLGLQKVYDIKPDQKIIGVVGRLKRQDLLVRILPDLPAHYRVFFVGIDEKSFSRKYPGLLSQETKDRIIFTGEVTDRPKLILHYALMHVHVLPSQMDGFGLVSVEAMAMGVPVIGSDYGGIPDVINHGKTGYIFNNRDLDALKTYIIELAENIHIRNQFTHAGAQSIMHNFHIERVVNDYENYFSSLLYTETGHNS